MRLTNPLPRVLDARALGGHSVWLRFTDRTEGVVDLRQAVADSPLVALRDERTFGLLQVDSGGLVWPGGLDWAPESLYALLVAANRTRSPRNDDGSEHDAAQRRGMPEISRFFGIIIRMLDNEHDPPHFHAQYGDYEVSIELRSGDVTGRFPKRALRMVLEWQELHQEELLENWERVRNGLPPFDVAPLQ